MSMKENVHSGTKRQLIIFRIVLVIMMQPESLLLST